MPDIDTRCYCARPGGCTLVLDPGPPGRLCPMCFTAGHSALTQNQIRWVRVDVANPVQIDEHRGSLERWQPALRATQAITKVDFDA
jgi:hypothetical protein